MNDRKYFYLTIQAKYLILRIGFGLLLLVQFSLFSQAQDVPFKKEFFLGARGGMIFSNVKFKPNVEQDLYIGNSAGFIFRMISEPHVGIQIELNYINKGWKRNHLPEQPKIIFTG
jgi:hypothetical protein